MANPVCLSPLKFYDDFSKQSHRKSYAYNRISPVITKLGFIPPFQFVIPQNTTNINLNEAYLYDANTDELISDNISQELINTGFEVLTISGHKVAIYNGLLPIQFRREGLYYLKLSSLGNEWLYYSEVLCFSNSTDDCIEIEYWNQGNNNFYIKNGVVAFPNNFHFKLLLKTELGKPEYAFEEESTKRSGYNFIERQTSKKVYKFNAILPEFICDALRIIRLCSDKIIKSNSDEYEALTFDIDTEWQTQGDLASVTCEFETDNIITNLGGFVSPLIGGDYNDDYNQDFNTQ